MAQSVRRRAKPDRRICALSQFCAGPPGSAGTCQVRRQLGDGCGLDAFGDDTCDSGLECRDAVCQVESIDACL